MGLEWAWANLRWVNKTWGLPSTRIGLGFNSNLSPKSSWASPIQTPLPSPNLGLVPQLKSKPKVLMGKPKAIKAFTNLGFSFGPNPLKSKSIVIFSLGLSATCSSSSPQEDYNGGSGGERGVVEGPWSWSRLSTFRAASTNATCAVFAAVFQRRRPGVEPVAAAWRRRPGMEPAVAAWRRRPRTEPATTTFTGAWGASSVEPGRLEESSPRASSTMPRPSSSCSGWVR